jgi:hypothetical protein
LQPCNAGLLTNGKELGEGVVGHERDCPGQQGI